jgi:hypothetical protein
MPRRPCAFLLALGALLAPAGRAAADEAPARAGLGLISQTETLPSDAAGATASPAASALAPSIELAEEPLPARPPDVSYGVAARLRWVSVPGWLLNAFTKKNMPLSSWGTGIELFRRKANFEVVVSFSYQSLSASDGNWLGSGNNAATDTNFVQFQHLALYGIDAAFIWRAAFNKWLGVHYGAGFGIGIVGGHILRTIDNSGDCTDANAGDPTQCHPANVTCTASSCNDAQLQAAGRFVSSDVPPVLPIINVVLGLDFRVPKVRGWEAKIEGGFYDAFYLGGGIGYAF